MSNTSSNEGGQKITDNGEQPNKDEENKEGTNWRLVEAGTGGKQLGTFETKEKAREYAENRFGESPAPAHGRIVWKGKKQSGRSRYILKVRKVLTDGGKPQNGDNQDNRGEQQ